MFHFVCINFLFTLLMACISYNISFPCGRSCLTWGQHSYIILCKRRYKCYQQCFIMLRQHSFITCLQRICWIVDFLGSVSLAACLWIDTNCHRLGQTSNIGCSFTNFLGANCWQWSKVKCLLLGWRKILVFFFIPTQD